MIVQKNIITHITIINYTIFKFIHRNLKDNFKIVINV